MRALLAVILLAAACGQPNETARWRAAKTVCVLVDSASFYDKMQNAAAPEGKAAAANAPPAYRLRHSGLMVYLKEEEVPPNTGYMVMTAHQAVETALKYPGSEGLCVRPDGPVCTRKLNRSETTALEAALRKDAGAPLPYIFAIKGGLDR